MTAVRSRLGFWSIVLLGVNGIIGSGIFLLPGKAMALMGPGSIFVYMFMAFLVVALTLCFAECAGRFTATERPTSTPARRSASPSGSRWAS